MFQKYLASVAFAGLASTSMAADLPTMKGPAAAPYYAPAAPVFTWSGFYIGVNAGFGFNNNNNNNGAAVAPFGFSAPTFFPFPFNPNYAPAPGNIYSVANNNRNSGRFLGGVQAGYNWQSGALVFGIEGDINGVANHNNRNNVAVVPAGVAGVVPYAIVGRDRGGSQSFGTVRGRLGFAVDRALFYVTGGVAFLGNGSNNNGISYFAANNGTATPTQVYTIGGRSNNRIGIALGAGMEYAFTNNWTAKIEYLYVGNGSNSNNNRNYLPVAPTGAPFVGTGFTRGSNNNNNGTNIVRVGLNYKF